MYLDELQFGQKALVVAMGTSHASRKLMEMGCIPGSEIALKMRAPLGDPLAFEVSGYCLSMRSEQAKLIEIELK